MHLKTSYQEARRNHSRIYHCFKSAGIPWRWNDTLCSESIVE